MSNHPVRVEALEARCLLSADPGMAGSISPAAIKLPAVSHSDKSSAHAGVRHLAEVMDRFHQSFGVYSDVSAAGNHFHAWGKIPDETAPVTMQGSWTADVHSVATSIRADFTPASASDFGGFFLMNGVLPAGATAPVPNFGTVPNAGVDLSGAKTLSFWAKGAVGGEQLEFFMGGVGWGDDPSPFPDSSPRIPVRGTVTTLTTQWTEYRIDLRHANLKYVLGGFGWVASATSNPQGATFFLDDIQYELSKSARKKRLNQPRFLASFDTLAQQPDPFDSNTDDDIDLALRNTAFSYDNSVALLGFLADRRPDSVRRARLIGDAFLYAMDHDRTYTNGAIRTDYAAGDIALPPGWTPNNLTGTVPVPGFYSDDRQRFFEVEQTALDTGNNAWVMIALLALYRQTKKHAYLDAATRIGNFIRTMRNDQGTYQGFLGGINNPETTPAQRPYASVEHNEDINAAFTVMAKVTHDASWAEDALHARQFVESMFDPTIGQYRPGTTDANTINTNADQVPLDVQAWGTLSNSLILTLHPQLLEQTKTTHGAVADGFNGFDFNTDKDGVWFEGTGQMAVALAFAGDTPTAQTLRGELQRAQAGPLTGDGEGIAAASHDGLTTGFNFKYFRRVHIAATAWNIFAQLGFNPYYSGKRADALSLTDTSEVTST